MVVLKYSNFQFSESFNSLNGNKNNEKSRKLNFFCLLFLKSSPKYQNSIFNKPNEKK
jgi:hypothetical protein